MRLLSLSLLFLFLVSGCDQLEELLGDLRVNNLVANYHNGEVQLSWDYVDGADFYDIWYYTEFDGNYQHVDNVYGSTSYIHHSEFQSNTYYFYIIRIKDFNGNWHEYSNPASVYIDGYGVVENLYVEMQGSSAYISWNRHDDAQEYELEYKFGEDGYYMHLATLDSNTTGFYHNDLSISAYYYYRIRFRNYNGNWSDFSEDVWVYSGDNHGGGDLRVNNLVANYYDGEVVLSWEYIEGANGYDIWFSEDEFGSYQHVDTAYNTSYTHYYGFQSDRYYYYKIRVKDYNEDWHDFSDVTSIYIPYGGGGNTISDFYVDMSGTSAYLYWSQQYDAQQYEIEYKLGEYGTYMYLTTVYSYYNTEFYHDNLQLETYYYYRIRYLDNSGNWSDFSDPIWIYSGDYYGGVVNNLYVETIDNSAFITWDVVYDAQQYEIEYAYSEYGSEEFNISAVINT